jgi:hypothetical protein
MSDSLARAREGGVHHCHESGPSCGVKQALRTATFFVAILSGEHGRTDEKEAKPKEERGLSLGMVKRLEKRLAERVAGDAQSGALIQRSNAASQIWAWERHAGAEPVRAWIAANLDVDALKSRF